MRLSRRNVIAVVEGWQGSKAMRKGAPDQASSRVVVFPVPVQGALPSLSWIVAVLGLFIPRKQSSAVVPRR